MERKRMSPAQFELMRRKLAQAPKSRTVLVDSADSTMPLQNAGHRAGKRKRGTSVLKRKPRASALIVRFDIADEHGNIVARDIGTVTYHRPSS